MPEPNSGCWLWVGASSPVKGRGDEARLPYLRATTTKGVWGAVKASRFTFEAFHGPIPAGAFVCHRCDTPMCVNPDHLFLGSQADNIADKVKKGRHPRGEQVSTKLTLLQAREIRQRADGGETHRLIAADYDITPGMVSAIYRRERWAAA